MSDKKIDRASVSSIPAEVIEDLAKFKPDTLNHVQIEEKLVLPSKEVIENEKQHLILLGSVERFDKKSLKHSITIEKAILPDKEIIESEKKAGEAN